MHQLIPPGGVLELLLQNMKLLILLNRPQILFLIQSRLFISFSSFSDIILSYYFLYHLTFKINYSNLAPIDFKLYLLNLPWVSYPVVIFSTIKYVKHSFCTCSGYFRISSIWVTLLKLSQFTIEVISGIKQLVNNTDKDMESLKFCKKHI